MKFTAQQISELLNGTVVGNADVWVDKLSKIEEGIPNSLSFLANPKYTEYVYTTDASIVIVNRTFEPEQSIKATLIKVDDAYSSFATLLEIYSQLILDKKGIEQPSYISSSAKIGKDVYIGAFAYIGHNVEISDGVKIYPHSYIGDFAKIGNNTTLFSGARVYQQCVIGSNCIIHSNAVIGADGFGFAPTQSDYKKIPQIGNVLIGNDVEIGALSAVDRATMGSTIIHNGVKLDNLIQVGHNAEIGENTVVAGHTAIAGSVKIGSDCMIAGQVGIVGHISIANKVKIAGQSGVGHTITTEGAIVQGSPAFDIGEYKRCLILFKALPKLKMKIDELEKNQNSLTK